MEADALPIMVGDVERNPPNSSDDKMHGGAIKRPKRNAAVPAHYLCRIYAVSITVTQKDSVHTNVDIKDNPELFLCVGDRMKKATQRPSRSLFKCQTLDEEEDRNLAYTRSYGLIAHLVNKHRLFLMNIRHNAPYNAVKSDLRPATAEEMIKYKDASSHRRKNAEERSSAGEASASCTTVEPEAPS